MALLMNMGKSRAIKKIAKMLPSFLVSGYGNPSYYTSGQVETAMGKTGCNENYVDHAYTMFCDKDTFNEVSSADFDSVHQEVADICFKGDSDFTFDNVASTYGDFGGTDSGGFCEGGGDGGGGD